MLTDKLKENTKPNHQSLEKLLIGRIRSIQTQRNYLHLLQSFHSFFGGLEEKIGPFLSESPLLPDYSSRRKTTALIHDIEGMGGKVNQFAAEKDLPHISNPLHAFGTLYVMEGSTLGGKIISRIIADNLKITNGKGLTFFNGYGDQTHTMWLSFKERLNELDINDDEKTEVVTAADETFIRFKNWLKKK